MSAHDKELEERVDTFLGEFRIIVPALGALLGFQLIAAMQSTYGELPAFYRGVNFAGVVSTFVALGFMLVPTAYHRLAPRLHEDEAFVVLCQRNLARGSLFLGLSLALSIYLQAARSFAQAWAGAAASIVTVLFLGFLWWAYPHRHVAEASRSRGRDADREKRARG